eukprot:scaffold76613_cov60-Phaeocystis_antarctica.AAC.2
MPVGVGGSAGGDGGGAKQTTDEPGQAAPTLQIASLHAIVTVAAAAAPLQAAQEGGACPDCMMPPTAW